MNNNPKTIASKNDTTNNTSAAAASLALLLKQDVLLTQHELHISQKSQQAAFSYAAALLDDDDSKPVQQQATQALAEVERKLALVESLAERVSRTSPQAVAGPLLRLHGYTVQQDSQTTTNTPMTLVATRERCTRLVRQSDVLQNVANRVETSLERGLNRMTTATSRLSRVLDLSATLKMMLTLQFEASKLQTYDLEDARDLVRAAASVAICQALLQSQAPHLQTHLIRVVQDLIPSLQETARAVRQAAGALLAQQNTQSSFLHLGTTLQVYFHLGELPQAAWSCVTQALDMALQACRDFWSASTQLSQLAKSQLPKKTTIGGDQRLLQKQLVQVTAQACQTWASGMLDAALLVWNLQRVLLKKTNASTRQVFIQVVAQAPIPQAFAEHSCESEFDLFSIFWNKLCHEFGLQVMSQFQERPQEVASLYPAIRAASIHMLLGSLHDTMQAGTTSTSNNTAWDGDNGGSSNVGILGGSAVLVETHELETTTSADTWTRNVGPEQEEHPESHLYSAGTSSSAIFHSREYKTWQDVGLHSLQQAFLEACSARLWEPLQYMFPEGVTVDDDGIPISDILPTVPSKYDMQKLDELIRSELSLADPREGGGELSMTTMLAEVVVQMVEQFCVQARGAVSDIGEKCIRPQDGAATEALVHDIKVAGVMSALAKSLRNAPENTFIVPYRPATNLLYEEAASACQVALLPAIYEIEDMVKSRILSPLYKALNRRVGAAITKMHYGTYFEESLDVMDGTGGTSFVQKHLTELYDSIAQEHLASLPSEYAAVVASSVATFSMYTFLSNVSLIRPLKETARLHITQDLADFELALEQLVFKAGSSLSLGQVEQGKPYAELRAVRQMLFWSGLDDKSASAKSLAKALLQEPWVKDVRISTICNFLFAFAPDLLSSPHHSKRMRPEEYVSELVKLDGSIEEGEGIAWTTTMACCDSYQQRESANVSDNEDGDKRVAALVVTVGHELLRRRRNC
jgi:hypothetical protein